MIAIQTLCVLDVVKKINITYSFVNKGICGKVFIWNPINSKSECDKLCNVGEYLDCASCKCRKSLIDNLV